jgi:hypothetical protein
MNATNAMYAMNANHQAQGHRVGLSWMEGESATGPWPKSWHFGAVAYEVLVALQPLQAVQFMVYQ